MSDEQSSPPLNPASEKVRRPATEPAQRAKWEAASDKNLGGESKYGVDNPGKVFAQVVGDGNRQENLHQGNSFDGGNHTHNYNNLDLSILKSLFGDILKKNSSDEESNKSALVQGIGDEESNKSALCQYPFARRPFYNEQKDKQQVPPSTIPQNEEEISNWYSQLSSYDQCFVQAMAIFASATIPEVFFATNRLYEPIAKSVRERATYALHTTMSTPLPQKLEAPDGGSLFERMRRTYVKIEYLNSADTKIEHVNSAECFSWQDVDHEGISRFQIRLLHFLARSAYMWTESIFLDQLKIWIESLEDENTILALRAQGVIWGHDHGDLSNEINRWSNNDEWYRASGLLYGAYIAEYVENPHKANDLQNSFVFRTIFKWVRKARMKTDAKKGQAAALAYTFIGLHNLPLALHGLDSLLELPQSKKMLQRLEVSEGKTNYDDDDDDDSDDDKSEFPIAADTFEGTVKAYWDLAVIGHTREILQHLTKHVEQSSHYRMALTDIKSDERNYHHLQSIDMKSDERNYHRLQRILTLIASFSIFFDIAWLSLINLKYSPWVNYDQTLPLARPATLYNTDGREILLAGLLNGEWTQEIRILICAALMEKSLGTYYHFALYLLWRWAILILKDQSPRPDQIRKTYVQFLVDIGHMLLTWGQNWSDLGFRAPSAFSMYKNRLAQWQREGLTKKHPIAALAQEILTQLSGEQH